MRKKQDVSIQGLISNVSNFFGVEYCSLFLSAFEMTDATHKGNKREGELVTWHKKYNM